VTSENESLNFFSWNVPVSGDDEVFDNATIASVKITGDAELYDNATASSARMYGKTDDEYKQGD
jgi:hypothetical protein